MDNKSLWFEDTGEDEKKNVRSVNNILEMVHSLEASNGGKPLWFRGEGKYCYGLRPTIGRSQRFVGNEPMFDILSERNLLHRFRRHAYPELRGQVGDWGALFLARHYGLPVRLLDWTSNALVSLYFAASFEKEEDACDAAVYGLVLREPRHEVDVLREETGDYENGIYYRNEGELTDSCIKQWLDKYKNTISFSDLQAPLRLKGVRILHPFDVTSRIITQGSAFTIQQNPWEDLEKYDPRKKDIKPQYVDIEKIIKWRVPGDAREGIIRELERSNINYRTLFPDLGGVAKGLWHLEVLRVTPNG